MSPNFTFEEKLKNKILGKKYSLSIAYISDAKMKVLNKKYRGKNKTTDILSFGLDKGNGEILISKNEAGRKARGFDMKKEDYLAYLLIHGMVHLKGFDHGAIMDRLEKKFCSIFKLNAPHNPIKVNEQKDNSRNRRRNLPSKSGSSRTAKRK